MPKYSIIIPVYNRPDEVDELLTSLVDQTNKDFEVLIIEDGSKIDCKQVVDNYLTKLELNYFTKENTGQGFSRNFGRDHASGDWLIFFDSDCVIPPDYITNLDELINAGEAHAFCGPDAARADFSNLQKAISYSMTSLLTTGGIRGRQQKVDSEAHLRSYNLVIRKDVFDELHGFAKTNMGEDMELSNRFRLGGYKALISQSLAVYHKRRNTLKSFYRQVFSFGRTRVQLNRKYNIPIKIPHLFPTVFTLGLLISLVGLLLWPLYGLMLLAVYIGYILLIIVHAGITNKSLLVGFLTGITSLIQHLGYGLGFIKESILPERS